MINFIYKYNRSLYKRLLLVVEFVSFFFKDSKKAYIEFCKKKFIDSKNLALKENQTVLIEYNNFHANNLPLSFFINFFKKKKNYKITAYDFFLRIKKTSKLFFFLKKILHYPNFQLFKSFGVNDFIFPKFSKEIKILAEEEFIKQYNEIKSKKDVENIHIKNIWIGDLIYDSYLKNNKVPTIDIPSQKFKDFLLYAFEHFYYWYLYFENNDVRAVILSHTVYIQAFVLRIAVKKKIECFNLNIENLYRLTNEDLFSGLEFKYFPETFKLLNEKENKLELARKNLERRMSGEVGVDMPYSTMSAYHSNVGEKVLKKSSNIKILVAPHCFFDSPHPFGKNLFSDFYEWLSYLNKFSRKKNYDWYFKLHPDFIPENLKIIKKFISRNKKFNLLNSNTSHHQIIKEGIDFCLTVYGTIGEEYAYKNKIVINACVNNPHSRYNFNINPQSIEEYNKILENLENIKLNINQKDVEEYYYMKNIYKKESWFLGDYIKVVNDLGGRERASMKLSSNFIYRYFLKNIYNDKFEVNFNKTLENFIYSSEYKCNCEFLKNYVNEKKY